jgi:hypothetical protein
MHPLWSQHTPVLLPQVTAQTPDFAVGAKDSIRLKPKPAAAAAGAAAAAAKPAGNAWLLAGDDLDGEELLDDEELLTEEDRQRPAGEQPVAGWGTGHKVL